MSDLTSGRVGQMLDSLKILWSSISIFPYVVAEWIPVRPYMVDYILIKVQQREKDFSIPSYI
jgi:hypothetical protein